VARRPSDEWQRRVDRAIELDPVEARAIGSRGQTFLAVGRHDEAQAAQQDHQLSSATGSGAQHSILDQVINDDA
jgi:hypothetical protein